MKKFVVASLIIGLSAVAQASTFNQYPTVGGVAVNNLCDAGSKFQTLTPVEVCTEWKNDVKTGEQYQGNEWTCVRSTSQVAKISKKYVVTTCNESQMPKDGSGEWNYPTPCTNKSSVTKTYGNTFTVAVMKNMGEMGLVQVGSFQHTVPACHGSTAK